MSSTKCLFGQMSSAKYLRRNVFGEMSLAKCLRPNVFGQMSFWLNVFGQISFWPNVFGQISSAKYLFGQMSLAKSFFRPNVCLPKYFFYPKSSSFGHDFGSSSKTHVRSLYIRMWGGIRKLCYGQSYKRGAVSWNASSCLRLLFAK